MQYSKEIINSDILSQNIPEQMSRHTQNFNMGQTNRNTDPGFKNLAEHISIDNLSIQEPEARLSNASNSRPQMNAPLQTQFSKPQKQNTFSINNRPPSGLGTVNEPDSSASVDQGIARPPLHNYQPEISPLANYMERSRSYQQESAPATSEIQMESRDNGFDRN